MESTVELSPPLRWLGAIAVMFVVLLITIPLLLDTVAGAVSLSDADADEAPPEATDVTSEDPSEPAAAPADDATATTDDAQTATSDDEFPTTYTVGAGDTGNDIAEQFYGSPDGWSTIADANDIDPGTPLRVGVELDIPAPE